MEVKNFINQVIGSQKKQVLTNGLGQAYKLESSTGKGSALVDESSVVHLDFFLGSKSIDTNTPIIRLEDRINML
jgi:hypothetical protein